MPINGLIDPIGHVLTDRPVRFLPKSLIPYARHRTREGARFGFQAVDGADTEANLSTFSAVTDALKAGEIVCLFPEGISHDEPQIQPLKTGAARMALLAESECMFQLGIQIIPVGLHLSKKEVFRSESAAWVGTPVTIDADVAETHGHDTRAAARALTDRIAEAMRTVTVNLNAWEDLELLELAGQIWTDEHDPVIRLQTMADAERTFVERHDSVNHGLSPPLHWAVTRSVRDRYR